MPSSNSSRFPLRKGLRCSIVSLVIGCASSFSSAVTAEPETIGSVTTGNICPPSGFASIFCLLFQGEYHYLHNTPTNLGRVYITTPTFGPTSPTPLGGVTISPTSPIWSGVTIDKDTGEIKLWVSASEAGAFGCSAAGACLIGHLDSSGNISSADTGGIVGHINNASLIVD